MKQAEYKGDIYEIETVYVYDEYISIYKGDLLDTEAIKVPLSEVKILPMHLVSHALTLADDNADLIDVTKRYGEKYHIEAVKGTKPDLSMMPLNQRVVYGDGIDYHFRLTKK